MAQDMCVVCLHLRSDMIWVTDTGTDAMAVDFCEFHLDG
jgi:hypothetical protein